MPADINEPKHFVKAIVQDCIFDARNDGRTIVDAAVEAQLVLDPWIYSNHSVNGRTLTWKELAERQRTELVQLQDYRRVITDLDRCEHGRRKGDECYTCVGPSKGNPLLDRGDDGVQELVLGYGLDGATEYVLRHPDTHLGNPVVKRRTRTGAVTAWGER